MNRHSTVKMMYVHLWLVNIANMSESWRALSSFSLPFHLEKFLSSDIMFWIIVNYRVRIRMIMLVMVTRVEPIVIQNETLLKLFSLMVDCPARTAFGVT